MFCLRIRRQHISTVPVWQSEELFDVSSGGACSRCWAVNGYLLQTVSCNRLIDRKISPQKHFCCQKLVVIEFVLRFNVSFSCLRTVFTLLCSVCTFCHKKDWQRQWKVNCHPAIKCSSFLQQRTAKCRATLHYFVLILWWGFISDRYSAGPWFKPGNHWFWLVVSGFINHPGILPIISIHNT